VSTVGARIRHAWNAFVNTSDPGTDASTLNYSSPVSYGRRPDRTRYTIPNERSILSSILTRLTIDVAGVGIKHVRLDENGRYLEDMDSGINDCLTVQANIDQPARQFQQDIAMTLFDKGVAAVVPVDTTIDPSVSSSFDIQTMRVGEIVAWYPRHVTLRVYNEAIGRRVDVTLEKKFVAIVENPLFSVMNEPNSTLQRLTRKLALLDTVDEASSSGKLDLIVQLPYVIKSEARRQQAETRRSDIEFQLKGSKYGIAYTDGTEKITQLNRPVENNLLAQIEYLTTQLYSQLGLTEEVMNGTANEATMLNYFNRTIEPVLDAIVQAMIPTFLTKTGRTQGQTIAYFRNVFKLVPVSAIADMADKFARNEILSSNEFRQILGFKPDKNPKSDQLVNSNMPQPSNQAAGDPVPSGPGIPTQVTNGAS
jgi:Phage portal protein